jgi:hypothetical protein
MNSTVDCSLVYWQWQCQQNSRSGLLSGFLSVATAQQSCLLHVPPLVHTRQLKTMLLQKQIRRL